MTAFRLQLEALGTALMLVQKLPSHAVWVLNVTNNDDEANPTVLNIFADYSEWASIAMSLRLKTIEDAFEDKFLSYRVGYLLVSLIKPEEKS